MRLQLHLTSIMRILRPLGCRKLCCWSSLVTPYLYSEGRARMWAPDVRVATTCGSRSGSYALLFLTSFFICLSHFLCFFSPSPLLMHLLNYAFLPNVYKSARTVLEMNVPKCGDSFTNQMCFLFLRGIMAVKMGSDQPEFHQNSIYYEWNYSF